MSERISIDTKKYHLLEESGLRAPGQRWNYASPEVQELARQTFGNLLPGIGFDGEGRPYFEAYDEDGREICGLSRGIRSAEDVPRAEIVRLLEGYLALQLMAQNHAVDPRLRAISATFRLPHPVRERRLFRIYEDLAGETRLLVLWGFGGKGADRSAVPAAEAVATLLGSTTEELSTVVQQQCTTRLSLATRQQALAAAQAAQRRGIAFNWRNPWLNWSLAGAAAMLLAGVVIANRAAPPPELKPKPRPAESVNEMPKPWANAARETRERR
jgi:hypothetical protein